MKKTYIIIGGVTAVLLLLSIWVYLLIYGTPKPVEQFFTDFSFSGTSDNIVVEPILPIDTNPIVDTNTAKLRQLTTRPVIGMREYTDSNNRFIRYTEAGTGHVYSINIVTGEEIRLSNITIIGASRAIFSPNGQFVAIASGYTNLSVMNLITLTLNQDGAQTKQLEPKMVDAVFSDTNELLYTEYSTTGLTGRSLDPQTLTTRQIFTVPFQNATIVWGKNASATHYVYPKTTVKLPGYLYEIKNASIRRVNISGLGLSALANDTYIISTILNNNSPKTRTYEPVSGEGVALPVVVEPSKCVVSKTDSNLMYCGNEKIEYGYEFPDDWYKGTRSFDDRIFEIDMKRGSAAQLVSPKTVTGREIDVINMNISDDGKMLYFMNKNDNTLWMYEI